MSEVMSGLSATTLAWSSIEARGEESASFLQGQLTQDLDRVGEEGAWTAGYLTPHDDGYDLVVPRELADAALARLRRFLLRTKCSLGLVEASAGPMATLDEQIGARWPGAAEFARSLTPHCFGRHVVEATISFEKGCFTGQELVARLDARGSSVPWRFVYFSGPSVALADALLRSKGPEGPQGVTSARSTSTGCDGLGVAHRTLLAAPGEGSEVTVEAID
jgi:folate-binding protein YgfZ